MTFATSMNAVLTRIALLSGVSGGVTTFTSSLKTVKISSEHFGVPNEMIQIDEVSFKYLPPGATTVTVNWEFDGKGIQSVTFLQDPFSYPVMGDTTANTVFLLASSQSDTTASDLPRLDDVYIQQLTVNQQGKSAEFSISVNGRNDFRPIGFEVKGHVAGRQAAYIGGIY